MLSLVVIFITNAPETFVSGVISAPSRDPTLSVPFGVVVNHDAEQSGWSDVTVTIISGVVMWT